MKLLILPRLLLWNNWNNIHKTIFESCGCIISAHVNDCTMSLGAYNIVTQSFFVLLFHHFPLLINESLYMKLMLDELLSFPQLNVFLVGLMFNFCIGGKRFWTLSLLKSHGWKKLDLHISGLDLFHFSWNKQMSFWLFYWIILYATWLFYYFFFLRKSGPLLRW